MAARRRHGPLVGKVPLFAPPGGTAVTSAAAVGIATCRALESRLDGDYPVAQANLTWRELVTRLARAAGNPNATKILDLPAPLMRTFFRICGVVNQLRGHERGLEPRTPGGHRYVLRTAQLGEKETWPNTGTSRHAANQ